MYSLTIVHSYQCENWDVEYKKWTKNKKKHRKNNPAFIRFNHVQQWYLNGKLHRDGDLPAVEWEDGNIEYWENGAKYLFIEYENGTKEYYHNHGKLHNDCGPAIIYANGDLEYWEYGQRHRKNGPAVIIGDKQYWFERGEFQKCIV